jgi:hypothetical protein
MAINIPPDTQQNVQNPQSRPWTAFKSALTFVGLGRLFEETAVEETHATTDSPFFSPPTSPQDHQGGANTPLSPTSAGERLISETAFFPAFPLSEAAIAAAANNKEEEVEGQATTAASSPRVSTKASKAVKASSSSPRVGSGGKARIS